MAGLMKTPLGTEVDLGPGHIVLDGVPAPAKGAQQPPLFGPCLLWPRSPILATAELLFIFFYSPITGRATKLNTQQKTKEKTNLTNKNAAMMWGKL